MKKKSFVFVVVLLFSLFLVGCKKNGDDNGKKPPEVKLTNVIFKDNQSMFQFDLESFRLKDIKLELHYSDETIKEVEVDRNMISNNDFKSLLTTGQYFIEINYLEHKLEALIEMTSNLAPQSHLPSVAIYALTRQEENKIIYDIYSTGLGNYYSFMMVVGHGFKIDDISYVEVISGVSSAKISAREIEVIYSFDKAISGDKHLYSIIVDATTLKEITFKAEDSLFLTFLNNTVSELNDIRYYIR